MSEQGKVIDLAAFKQEREPHTSGPVKCMHCAFQWVGVMAVGVEFVECPACHFHKGVKENLVYPDINILHCCHQTLFCIGEDGYAYCVLCGAAHEPRPT